MLPDIETVSAEVHAAWMKSKLAQGVTTRKAEDGEELMVPYSQLSEKAKELDRGSVRAVYDAMLAASPSPTTPDQDAVEAKYNELIYAVGSKWPNESRHQTALRYIRERENQGHSHGNTVVLDAAMQENQK